MKIIVLHGDDSFKSYERLEKFVSEAKRRNWEILYDELSLTPSLFGAERLLVVRDPKLITKRSVYSISKIDGTLVIYHEGTLSKTFLDILPKDTKKEEFKIPKLIWGFLEHLYPGNADKCIQEFHRIIETDPVELVFSLIAKQFRDLYWIELDSESLPYPSWRLAKLKNQAKRFRAGQLREIITKLAEIDIKVKSSKANLVSSLDLLIIKQLE